MSTIIEPWIEVNDRSETEQATGARAEGRPRALVAAMVLPRSYAERNRMRWGFNFGAAYDEYKERLVNFIDWLYMRQFQAPNSRLLGRRSIALRCILSEPGQPLNLSVVAAVRDVPPARLRAACLDFFEELAASFPYDYQLVPAQSQEDFMLVSGRDFIESARDAQSLVEVGRKEFALPDSPLAHSAPGEWLPSKQPYETMWRALASAPAPVLFNVMVHPTQPQEIETAQLNALARLAEAQSAGSAPPLKDGLTRVGQLCKQRAAMGQPAFCVQVHLLSPGVVPPALPRLVGGVLTHAVKPGEAGGFQLGRVRNTPLNRDHLFAAEPVYNRVSADSPRLPLLASLQETSAVLQLPYFSEFGLPGVEFASRVGQAANP